MDHLKITIDSIRNLKQEYFNEQSLPAVIEHKRRNDSQFSNLLEQLWSTESVLCHFSSSNSEAHWPLLQELDCVVGRAIKLVKEVCFKSEDSTSRREHDTEEHYLEVFLDLRWWTWVLTCSAPFRIPCLRKSIFVTPKGKLDPSSSRLPSFMQKLYLWWSSSDGYARHLPSYGIEVFVQETEGPSNVFAWLESGEPLDKFVLQSAEIFIIEGKVLVPVPYAQKPSWVGVDLKVDLTQVFLGMSSSGLVIKCEHSGTEYALKRVQNFGRRQPVIARLCHPHIVQLMSYWRENGFLFLMMELMEGDFKDLIRRRLRVKKPLFIMNVVLDILLQIAKAMLYLHDMGLTHPHLKSSDVLFKETADRSKMDKDDTKYLVKLGDFQFYSKNDFESMAQRNVYQFGLICLEVLSTEPLHWELEDSVMDMSEERKQQVDELQSTHGDAIPGSLTQCITRCLDGSTKFSEVVVMLLLAQLQVLTRATKETSPRSLDTEHQGILSSLGSSSRFTMITEMRVENAIEQSKVHSSIDADDDEVGEEVAEVGKGTSVQDEIEQLGVYFSKLVEYFDSDYERVIEVGKGTSVEDLMDQFRESLSELVEHEDKDKEAVKVSNVEVKSLQRHPNDGELLSRKSLRRVGRRWYTTLASFERSRRQNPRWYTALASFGRSERQNPRWYTALASFGRSERQSTRWYTALVSFGRSERQSTRWYTALVSVERSERQSTRWYTALVSVERSERQSTRWIPRSCQLKEARDRARGGIPRSCQLKEARDRARGGIPRSCQLKEARDRARGRI